MNFQLKNNSITALTDDIDDTQLTFDVDSPGLLPTPSPTKPVYLRVKNATDLEYMICTDITGNTLTVTRGEDDSIAAEFDAGDEIIASFNKAIFENVEQLPGRFPIPALNIDCSEPAIQTKTLVADTTMTYSEVKQGKMIMLEITGAGGWTFDLPGSAVALLGTSFTLDVKNYIFIFFNDDTAEQLVIFATA